MIVSVITALIVYYIFDPITCDWMPKCPSKYFSGYECPGCGMQRALHAILHGDFGKAWLYNKFLIIGLPYLTLTCYSEFRLFPGAGSLRKIVNSKYVAGAYIFMYFSWWIIRNMNVS